MYNDNPFWKFRRKLLENQNSDHINYASDDECPICGRGMSPSNYCEKCDYPSEKDKPKPTMSRLRMRKLGLIPPKGKKGKKGISEAKKERGGSYEYAPPEEWTDRDGQTRRAEYIAARNAETESVRKKAIAAVDLARQVPDHGVSDKIHDIINGGTSRELERHSYPLRSSSHPHLKQLGDHLQDLAHRRSKNPPHPIAPEPDYEPTFRLRRFGGHTDPGDPGRHFPFYPDQ